MNQRIHQPITKTAAAACLIALATGLAAFPTAADHNPGHDNCNSTYIDYKEIDIPWIWWQKFHMYDHGIGWGDPAEMEDPGGEWDIKRVVFVLDEENPHGLDPGWTVEHAGAHTPCRWQL